MKKSKSSNFSSSSESSSPSSLPKKENSQRDQSPNTKKKKMKSIVKNENIMFAFFELLEQVLMKLNISKSRELIDYVFDVSIYQIEQIFEHYYLIKNDSTSTNIKDTIDEEEKRCSLQLYQRIIQIICYLMHVATREIRFKVLKQLQPILTQIFNSQFTLDPINYHLQHGETPNSPNSPSSLNFAQEKENGTEDSQKGKSVKGKQKQQKLKHLKQKHHKHQKQKLKNRKNRNSVFVKLGLKKQLFGGISKPPAEDFKEEEDESLFIQLQTPEKKKRKKNIFIKNTQNGDENDEKFNDDDIFNTEDPDGKFSIFGNSSKEQGEREDNEEDEKEKEKKKIKNFAVSCIIYRELCCVVGNSAMREAIQNSDFFEEEILKTFKENNTKYRNSIKKNSVFLSQNSTTTNFAKNDEEEEEEDLINHKNDIVSVLNQKRKKLEMSSSLSGANGGQSNIGEGKSRSLRWLMKDEKFRLSSICQSYSYYDSQFRGVLEHTFSLDSKISQFHDSSYGQHHYHRHNKFPTRTSKPKPKKNSASSFSINGIEVLEKDDRFFMVYGKFGLNLMHLETGNVIEEYDSFVRDRRPTEHTSDNRGNEQREEITNAKFLDGNKVCLCHGEESKHSNAFLKIWDINRQKILNSFDDENIINFSVNKENKNLIYAITSDSSIKFIDLRCCPTNSANIKSSNNRRRTEGKQGIVYEWKIYSNYHPFTNTLPTKPNLKVIANTQNQIFIGSSSGLIYTFENRTGIMIDTIKAHEKEISKIYPITPNLFLSCSKEQQKIIGGIKLWNTHHSFSAPKHYHSYQIHDSPSSSSIVSNSFGGTGGSSNASSSQSPSTLSIGNNTNNVINTFDINFQYGQMISIAGNQKIGKLKIKNLVNNSRKKHLLKKHNELRISKFESFKLYNKGGKQGTGIGGRNEQFTDVKILPDHKFVLISTDSGKIHVFR